MKFLLVALAACLASAASARAQTAPGPTIEIAHPFARATAATAKTGAAYFTIVNNGTSDDRLVAAYSPVAEKSEPHSTIDDNGVMRMRPLADIEVKAGGRVELKPGGVHLMLIGLKVQLKLGQSFPLTLNFAKAGAVSVMVAVEKAGAVGGQAMPGMKM